MTTVWALDRRRRLRLPTHWNLQVTLVENDLQVVVIYNGRYREGRIVVSLRYPKCTSWIDI